MALPLQHAITENGIVQGDLYRLLSNIADLVNELQADHATLRTVIGDIKTLTNDIRAKMQGNYVIGVPALAIGSNADDVATAAFDFMIGGKLYSKAAVTAGTGPGTDVIPQETFGAVALDIGADGTIDAVSAADNATGYASAVLAVAGLPAAATGHARIGWVTVTKSDGDFTFGTTNLDAANTTVAYTDAPTLANSIGSAVSSSAPAALTNSTALTLTL